MIKLYKFKRLNKKILKYIHKDIARICFWAADDWNDLTFLGEKRQIRVELGRGIR
jgi:hypothetical protein